MLLQIRDYMRKEKIASNQQLSREFGLDLTALQPMLDCWLKKGILIPCSENTACQQSCFKCKKETLVYYQYVS